MGRQEQPMARWELGAQEFPSQTFSSQDGMEGALGATFPSLGIAPRCNEITLEWDQIVQEEQGKAQSKLLVLNKASMLRGQSPAGRDTTVAYSWCN